MRGAAVVVVALAAGVVLSGCSGADEGSSAGESSAGDGVGVHATLRRSTLFETHRALSLTVRSDRDGDVHIGDIQLDSPLFESVPPEDRDARVRAGRATGMPLPFGPADCSGEADGPAELVASVDGEEVRVAMEESPSDLLDTLQGNECAEVAIREQVDLKLDDGWERTGPTTIEGDLVMAQRHDGVTASIEQMTGNVLFTVSTDADVDGDTIDDQGPWLEVSDDQPSTSGRIHITVSRCDPHGLIEFKRPFVITGFVTLGDADAVRVDIEAQGSARQAMGDLMSGCLGAIED